MLFCFTGSAQRTPQTPATSATTARNAALVAATNDVLKETSEIRQLSILHPVQSSTQSRAEIERMIIRNLEQDTTPAEMHADEVMLKRLGLAPEDFQYRALIIRLLTEQVAGYYDPKTRQFHLADWIDLDGQKPIMAHELTHALQDQHFDLRRFEHWPKGDSDAELAAHALIEGDATLVMVQYISNNPLRALAFLKSLVATGMSSVELEKSPRAVRETLLFPYQEGLGWTRNLYREGGWDRVSQAFNQLPQSTEQILHPEKYFAHEAPVKVTLPDIAPLLNAAGQKSEIRGRRSDSSEVRDQRSEFSRFAASADGFEMRSVPPALAGGSSYLAGNVGVSSAFDRNFSPAPGPRFPAPASWRRLTYDVEGEWGFYLILDQFLTSSTDSRRAAAGWGGDRFEVYEGPNGQACFISLSVWDTENDAREFFDAYMKRTQLRYPGATEVPSKSELRTPNTRVWKTSDGTVSVELRGLRALIVEGMPQEIDSKRLLKSLWQ